MRHAFFLLSLFCFAVGWLSFDAAPLSSIGFFLAAILAGGLSQIAKEVLK